MDVKLFYQQMRELALQMPADSIVIKSLSTPNGGKAGVFTEVNRQTAASQVILGSAVLATGDESKAYYRDMETKRQIAEKAQTLTRLQVSLATAAPPQPLAAEVEEESRGE